MYILVSVYYRVYASDMCTYTYFSPEESGPKTRLR